VCLTKDNTALRFGSFGQTTVECRSRASVTQLKIMNMVVKWIAFSCALFRDNFVTIGI
jgi:hypothetical protein